MFYRKLHRYFLRLHVVSSPENHLALCRWLTANHTFGNKTKVSTLSLLWARRRVLFTLSTLLSSTFYTSCKYMRACALSHFRCVLTPFQAPLSVGFSRHEYWSGFPWSSFSKGSSQPRDGTHISYISCIGRRVLYHYCHLGSPGGALKQFHSKIHSDFQNVVVLINSPYFLSSPLCGSCQQLTFHQLEMDPSFEILLV